MRSKVRELININDVEDTNVYQTYDRVVPCQCACCIAREGRKTAKEVEMMSDGGSPLLRIINKKTTSIRLVNTIFFH